MPSLSHKSKQRWALHGKPNCSLQLYFVKPLWNTPVWHDLRAPDGFFSTILNIAERYANVGSQVDQVRLTRLLVELRQECQFSPFLSEAHVVKVCQNTIQCWRQITGKAVGINVEAMQSLQRGFPMAEPDTVFCTQVPRPVCLSHWDCDTPFFVLIDGIQLEIQPKTF